MAFFSGLSEIYGHAELLRMAAAGYHVSFSSGPTVTIVITIGPDRVAVVSLAPGWIVRPDGHERFVIERFDPLRHAGGVGIPVPRLEEVIEDQVLPDLVPEMYPELELN